MIQPDEYDGPQFEATIEDFDRLHNTENGNPRFRVHFDDGRVAETRPDTGEAYGIESAANRVGPVHVRTDVEGHIWSVEPVQARTTPAEYEQDQRLRRAARQPGRPVAQATRRGRVANR